jgi:hypothetical protein
MIPRFSGKTLPIGGGHTDSPLLKEGAVKRFSPRKVFLLRQTCDEKFCRIFSVAS